MLAAELITDAQQGQLGFHALQVRSGHRDVIDREVSGSCEQREKREESKASHKPIVAPPKTLLDAPDVPQEEPALANSPRRRASLAFIALIHCRGSAGETLPETRGRRVFRTSERQECQRCPRVLPAFFQPQSERQHPPRAPSPQSHSVGRERQECQASDRQTPW
jgi:hypothetical protein